MVRLVAAGGFLVLVKTRCESSKISCEDEALRADRTESPFSFFLSPYKASLWMGSANRR